MRCSFRTMFSVFAVLCTTSGAFAAGSTPADYVPDPALKTASVNQLRTRVANACVVIQARENNASEGRDLNNKCACYARQTLSDLTPEELQSYRDTGVFNRGARRKAIAALEQCGLKRP